MITNKSIHGFGLAKVASVSRRYFFAPLIGIFAAIFTLETLAQAPNAPQNEMTSPVVRSGAPSVVPGSVLAIAVQKDGKIIIGGSFSMVNGVVRHNIARLEPGGSLDRTWDPGANNVVRRIIVSGNEVFVLGEFSMIGGQPRGGVAKLDLKSGEVDSRWNPIVPGNLHALAVSGTNVFVGGLSYLGKLNTADTDAGQSSWGPQPDYNIIDLVVVGDNLYVGGNFTALGNSVLGCLARVNILGAGTIDPGWNAHIGGAFGGSVRALLAEEGLVVGGSFNGICGSSRTNLALITLSDPALVDGEWFPNPVGRPTGYDWNGVEAGSVNCLLADGNDLYVAGVFNSIGGVARTNVAKLAMTGYAVVETSWTVDTAGGGVFTLAAGKNGIFAGGSFETVNAVRSPCLVKLDPLTGDPDKSFHVEVGYPQY